MAMLLDVRGCAAQVSRLLPLVQEPQILLGTAAEVHLPPCPAVQQLVAEDCSGVWLQITRCALGTVCGPCSGQLLVVCRISLSIALAMHTQLVGVACSNKAACSVEKSQRHWLIFPASFLYHTHHRCG